MEKESRITSGQKTISQKKKKKKDSSLLCKLNNSVQAGKSDIRSTSGNTATQVPGQPSTLGRTHTDIGNMLSKPASNNANGHLSVVKITTGEPAFYNLYELIQNFRKLTISKSDKFGAMSMKGMSIKCNPWINKVQTPRKSYAVIKPTLWPKNRIRQRNPWKESRRLETKRKILQDLNEPRPIIYTKPPPIILRPNQKRLCAQFSDNYQEEFLSHSKETDKQLKIGKSGLPQTGPHPKRTVIPAISEHSDGNDTNNQHVKFTSVSSVNIVKKQLKDTVEKRPVDRCRTKTTTAICENKHTGYLKRKHDVSGLNVSRNLAKNDKSQTVTRTQFPPVDTNMNTTKHQHNDMSSLKRKHDKMSSPLSPKICKIDKQNSENSKHLLERYFNTTN